jgi:hypothetical protein
MISIGVEGVEKYVTTNFYLAASLIASGAKLEKMDTEDMKHIKFMLEGDNISYLVEEWNHKELMVNARDNAEAIREIKSKIHEVRG